MGNSKWVCLLRMLFSFFLMIAASGCGSRSLDDFQEEGEGVVRSLIQELKAIHTREELLAAQGRLQRQFDRLVSIMIAAEEFNFSHSGQIKGSAARPHSDLSDQLRVELNRLYQLEGGRQIIEKCQEKALYRLDAFEKRYVKKIDYFPSTNLFVSRECSCDSHKFMLC